MVTPKHGGVKLTQRDGTAGTVIHATLKHMYLTVLQDDGKQIEVRDESGLVGWLDRSDAVPVAEAVDYFTEQLKANPKDADALARRGAARWQLGQHDRALEDYAEVLKLEPEQATYHFNRGQIYFSRGEDDKAVKDYDEAIRLDPNFALAFAVRGVSQARSGHADKALADFDAAVRLDPQDPRIYPRPRRRPA